MTQRCSSTRPFTQLTKRLKYAQEFMGPYSRGSLTFCPPLAAQGKALMVFYSWPLLGLIPLGENELTLCEAETPSHWCLGSTSHRYTRACTANTR
jgi:hypothetical protein